jgi:hypothetical protein
MKSHYSKQTLPIIMYSIRHTWSAGSGGRRNLVHCTDWSSQSLIPILDPLQYMYGDKTLLFKFPGISFALSKTDLQTVIREEAGVYPWREADK